MENRFAVAALGRVLDIRLHGPMTQTTLFFPPLFAAFTPSGPEDEALTRVRCDWQCIGEEAIDNGVTSYADIRWHREGEAAWAYETHQLTLRLTPEESVATFRDVDGAIENLLRSTLTFPFQPDRGLVFHSATPIFRGADGEAQTVMLAGFSGAGKSTISREGGWEGLLTNEMSFVERRGAGEWWAWPSPFWGKGDRTRRAAGPVRLVGMAILEQAPERNTWARLRPGEMMRELTGHAGVMSGAQVAEAGYVRRLGELCAEVPAWRFGWHRGSAPWAGGPWEGA